MYRNKYGKIEMHPIPNPGKGKLFVLGESVSLKEIKSQKYFNSIGGKILKTTIRQNNMPLDECCFSTVIPFMLPKSKFVPKEALEKNKKRIIQEIKNSGAKVVMTLGVFVTNTLLNTKTVTMKSFLGTVLSIPELPNVAIIPNYHPAIMNTTPGKFIEFNKVVESCVMTCRYGIRTPGVTKWEWINTRKELQQLIDILNKTSYVGCDIETSSLLTYRAQVWVIGIAIHPNEVYVLSREIFVKNKRMINTLFNSKCKFIWHNGKYDTEVLYWSDVAARLDEDTIYLHYCTNEAQGTHNLGRLSTLYLGADEYKKKMNSEFSNIKDIESYKKWKEELGERVAIDADYTLQLYEILKQEVNENEDYKKLYTNTLIPGAIFLTRVENRGLAIDTDYIKHQVPFYTKSIDEKTKQIQKSTKALWDKKLYMEETGAKSASEKFKPTSVQQLAWLMYDRLKLKPEYPGARQKRETGAEILKSIPNAPKFIQEILDLRGIKKEYSTYFKSYLNLVDNNKIVHPKFNLHSTVTGRLSCVEPNAQNIPSGKPQIREMIIPRDKDRLLMEVDYSGAELRVLAYLSGDKRLENALVHGDPHSELAEKIFGDAFTKGEARAAHNLRGMAKTVNFGIAYGRGANNLSQTFDISKTEAQSWINTWAKLYSKAWEYLQECEYAIRNGKSLTTLYGRYRRPCVVTPKNFGNLVNEAKNFRVQGVSSDNLLTACIKVDKLLEEKYGALIINLIHDSVLIDCSADHKTMYNVASIMAKEMIETPYKEYGCTVPFKVDVDIGLDWGHVYGYNLQDNTVEYKEGKITKIMSYEEWLSQERRRKNWM